MATKPLKPQVVSGSPNAQATPATQTATPAPAKAVFPSADLVMKVCPDSSRENVKKYVPYILKAMATGGMVSKNELIGVIATIYVETRGFDPIEEIGKGGGKYGVYYGRGFVQLTHKENYVACGKALGLDLVGNPALALQPETAARSLVWFFKTNGVTKYAKAGDFDNVRSMVNAGHPGAIGICWGVDVYRGAVKRGQQYFTQGIEPSAVGALPVDGSYGLGCADSGAGGDRTITQLNPQTQGGALVAALGIAGRTLSEAYKLKVTLDPSADPNVLDLEPQKTLELKGIGEGLDGTYNAKDVIFWLDGPLTVELIAHKPDPNAPPPQVFVHDTNTGLSPTSNTPPPNVPAGSVTLPVVCWLQTDNKEEPDRTCNTSSSAMAAKFLGAKINSDDEYLDIRKKYGDSTSMEAQTAALASLGIKSTHVANLDFADLDKQLAKGKPMTISIAHRGPESSPNLNKWHVICVIGRTPKGDYIVNDPYGSVNDGYKGDPKKGCGAIYTRQTLQRRWLPSGAGTGWGRLF